MKRLLLSAVMLLLLAGCGGGAGTVAYNAESPLIANPVVNGDGIGLAVLKDISGAPAGVRISWTRVNVTGVQGYYIYRNTSTIPAGNPTGNESLRINGGSLIAQSGSGTGTLTFDDTFSPNVGDTFFYRMTVVNSTSDESDFSAELSITIAQHTIITVSPSTTVSIGDDVTITGTFFGSSRGPDKVYFSDSSGAQTVEADYSGTNFSWSPTEIIVQVPYGAADGNVAVQVDGVSVVSPVGEEIDYAEPHIDTLTPDEDWVDNLYIDIAGTDFGPTSQLGVNTIVKFGSVNATVYDAGNSSDTLIKVKVPSGMTTYTANVHVDLMGNDSNNALFTILPHLDSLGDTDGYTGDALTLNGTTFTASNGTVTLGGISATVSNWTNTAVLVTVPAAATDGDVILTRDDSEVTNGIGFDIIPTITSVSPARRTEGTPVTITGTGFGSTRNGSTVTFNGGSVVASDVDYLSWGFNQIVVNVPAGAETGTITVHINDASVGTDQDTATSASTVTVVLTAPNITGVGQL